eukprot:CAMPEP_0113939890 /NCGR_PEP_ID=MMETSP1339-20121228/6124_1 /TAXON_ID=94617 /ORGANISM="Fibrocapsa japonica" /LENGTH=377 /DNA_ID=CAMNT_0000943529 /DNA_START=45 /DNA_END=1178 /DNA_ORIENTATION=+ /assembly_acc=CAM_ASM_000762
MSASDSVHGSGQVVSEIAELAEDELSLRGVTRVDKPTALPVWPVWSGVICFFLDRLGLKAASQFLEDRVGGRVRPMILDPYEADPFVLLVHHRHSFWLLDPLRYISKALLPEGFPAHPHRGFETVTYVMKGGMIHRDSMGVKQSYGNGAVQWLTAGKGILHEEMWDLTGAAGDQIEIYQIWVNLPSYLKMSEPAIQLLGNGGDMPLAKVSAGPGVTVCVIGGSAMETHSQAKTATDLAILHCTLEPGAEWKHRVPTSHRTCFGYVQRGQLNVQGRRMTIEEDGKREELVCPPHSTIFFGPRGDMLKVKNSGNTKAELLLLSGEPIGEPVVAQGPMVMNSEAEIQQAQRDVYYGKFGPQWDHKLPDKEWTALIDRSKY